MDGVPMIPLNTFNAAKVLDGARVPLTDPKTPGDRWEWIDDTLLAQIAPYKWEKIEGIVGRLMMDPTDADTARLIDRRVAEAIRTAREISAAVLNTGKANGGWWLTTIFFNGDVELTRLQRKCLDEIERCADNLPEARARLLYALYPPVSA